MDYKICSKCKKELPYPESFFKDKSGKNGYKAHCKKCDVAIERPSRKTQAFKDKSRARTKASRAAHPEQREKHATRIKKYLRHLRATSPEYRAYKAEKDRQYRQSPAGKASMAKCKAKRRHLEKGATLTGEQWENTLKAFDSKCAYCRKDTTIIMDHFIPLSAGGKTEVGNMVPACFTCNSKKQHFMPSVWCSESKYDYVTSILNEVSACY